MKSESPRTPEQQDREIAGLVQILWIILGASLLVHVLCLLAAHWWFKDWVWPREPFHSTVETAGAIIALGVAWMLLSLEKLRFGTSYNIWIASALIGMGILDGLHAMVNADQVFVWLHSVATMVGGVLFAMVWLPDGYQQRARWFPWTVMCFVLSLGIASILFPEHLPLMMDDGGFKPTAMFLNVGGGVLLFATSVRLVLTFRRTGNSDDLLFCLHCTLFGAAAIMFEQSKIWDLPWWGWHFLRLMAYGVALWFVVKTDVRTAKMLRLRAATQARVEALQENAEQLELANAQLHREQFLVNSLVNTIPDAVFFKDCAGRIIRANQAMANDVGVDDPAELIGKTDQEIWAGQFHAETILDERRIIETGEPLVNKEEMPMAKGGGPRWVLVTKMPLFDAQGEITGIFGVAREITEIKLQELAQKKQAAALAKAKESLERSNADLQQFAYVASHDLQEPLRAVSGHCQLLENALADNTNDRVQMFLRHATDGAKRMQELISNLLDYSRVESRGQEFVVANVQEIVNEAISNLSVSIEEHAAIVDVSKLPLVRGDYAQLVRLFQNLIGNAIKFCGDKRPEVRISAARESDRWVFSVHDNGIGLDSEYKERIFVIFQRLHARTEYPGTGLGLAISKRIVERHEGRIWVQSKPGAGSTFLFTLLPAS